MQTHDIPAVSALLNRLFERYIAADFPHKARGGIRQYISEQALAARMNLCHFAIVCRANTDTTTQIVGLIEVRQHKHITLLFVDDAYQRQGIARALLNRAITRCRTQNPDLSHLTLRASPYAVPIYTRLGFEPDAENDEPDSPAQAMKLLLTPEAITSTST